MTVEQAGWGRRPGLPRPRAWAARIGGRISPVALVVAVLIAYLALVPIGYLLRGAFFDDGAFTLSFFEHAYSSVRLGTMVGNSVVFAAGSTALAVAIGTALAFVVVRTDAPFKRLIFVASLVPLIVPGLLYTIAWILLAAPRIGVLNKAVEPLFGEAAVDVFSMGGMIVVEGLHLAPLAFLLMAAALRSADGALEEAAISSGAPMGTVLRRITLPLVRPAIAAAVLVLMVRSLEAFEVPALLGLPADLPVFTSRIWRSVQELPPDYGEAGAYALSLLLATAVGVVLYRWLTRRGSRFQTLRGGTAPPPRVELGRWRWPATALVLVYFLFAVALPVLILVYASTQPFYAPPSADRLSGMTVENFGEVLSDGRVADAAANSLLLAVATATAVMAVMAVAAWIVVRSRIPGRGLLDGLASAPLAIPGIVLGVALLFVYLRFPLLSLYGTLWILLLAYVTRFMPYGMRFAASAMQQLGPELEESARASGAGWWQTFRRVLLPLVFPGLIAGWIYVLIVSVREFSASILLYSPGTEVISVRIFEQYEAGRFPELSALAVLLIAALSLGAALVYRLGGRIGAWEGGAG
jgi:iron(III) transport system permease protein